MKKFPGLLLLAALALGGCSSFSQTGRQQRAYQKYVRKSSNTRIRQQARFHSDKARMPTQPMPSEPTTTTTATESGPQSVPTDH